MIYVSMFFVGLMCWLIATITAGGAGLIFLAVAGFFVPLPLATMILGFAGTLAGFYRVVIYRHNVNWDILKWLIPGTLIGAILGALLFGYLVTDHSVNVIKVFLGLLLIITGFLGFFKISMFDIKPKKYHFLITGIFTSFLSGLIGASSPLMNSLFQKFSLKPNQIIGTKSFNIFLLQLSKTLVFVFSIVLTQKVMLDEKMISTKDFFTLGLITATGSMFGVYIGKKILSEINEEFFNKLLNMMMLSYGIYLLINLKYINL